MPWRDQDIAQGVVRKGREGEKIILGASLCMLEKGRGEDMEKKRRGKGERRAGGEEVRGQRGEGGRGGDGGSVHSPYCHNISLSLQLCEEELKTEHVIHPLCIFFLSY